MKAAFSVQPGETRTGWLEWLAFCLMAVVFAVFEGSFFAMLGNFPFFGAVPDLVLVTVAGFAFFLGSRAGGIAGIIGGFVCDAVLGSVLPVSALVYFLCGYIVGKTNATLPTKGFSAYAVPMAVLLPVRAALTAVRTLLYAGGMSLPWLFVRALLPEAAVTFAAAAALYPLFRRLFGARRDGNISFHK